MFLNLLRSCFICVSTLESNNEQAKIQKSAPPSKQDVFLMLFLMHSQAQILIVLEDLDKLRINIYTNAFFGKLAKLISQNLPSTYDVD